MTLNDYIERRSGEVDRRSNFRDAIDKLNLLRDDVRALRDQLNEMLAVTPDSELFDRVMIKLDQLIEFQQQLINK